MTNFLIHSRDIDRDFTAFYQSLYMQREWGVEVGYATVPMYWANNRKIMLDYQQLSSVDCNNEYLDASQGHLSYDCCTSGTTKVTTSPQVNCCPVGYIYNTTTGLCDSTTSGSTTTPIDCPCCPDGYTYYSPTGVCTRGANSDIKQPIQCGTRCIDPFGADTDLIVCPDLVAASVILQVPGLGAGLCCETMVTPWDDCGWGNDQWDIRNRHLG